MHCSIIYYKGDLSIANGYHPFGMLMPWRHWGNTPGNGTGGIIGGGVPANLVVNSRDANGPAQYTATAEIDFLPGFESGDGDAFVAYIDPNGSAGSSSTSVSGNGNYRFGFNGKEKDNEDFGEGNAYDFGDRILDPRLGGRWFSVDPLQKKYPGESNYVFVGNNPIIYADVDGRDKIYTLTIIGKDGKTTTIKKVDKNYFAYTKIETPGYFNPNKFYKSDVYVNITIEFDW